MSVILRDIVVSSTHTRHVKEDTDTGRVCKPKCLNQLLPLPTASPPRDELFIDDTSDVDVNDRYVVLLC